MGNLEPHQIAELDQTTALIDDHVDVLLSAVLIRFAFPPGEDEDARREIMESAIQVVGHINQDPQDGILFAITLATRLASLMCVHYDTHSVDLEHALTVHRKTTYDISEKFREIQARGPRGCDSNTQPTE
jgi:hypothetical protein